MVSVVDLAKIFEKFACLIPYLPERNLPMFKKKIHSQWRRVALRYAAAKASQCVGQALLRSAASLSAGRAQRETNRAMWNSAVNGARPRGACSIKSVVGQQHGAAQQHRAVLRCALGMSDIISKRVPAGDSAVAVLAASSP